MSDIPSRSYLGMAGGPPSVTANTPTRTTGGMSMDPITMAALAQGGMQLFGNFMGGNAQARVTRESLAQQLQMFREQQAFLERQALEDQRRYDAQQAQEKTRWDAQQKLRAPYREASARLLDGAFGGAAIGRYPGANTLGDLMQRG